MKQAFFKVHRPDDIAELAVWLQRRDYTISRHGPDMIDRKGNPLIGLWNGRSKSGLILCINETFDDTLAEVVRNQRAVRAA